MYYNLRTTLVLVAGVLVGLDLLPINSIAQTITGERINYVMPSAEGAALVKAVERMPSVATGVPDIAIPIYTLPESGLTLALTYNTSGLLVDELPTLVGMGWRLETGGLITRVVKGLPDDYPTYGYLNRSASLDAFSSKPIAQYTSADIATLKTISPNNWDDSPDIFYYDVLGLKGKFVLGRNGEAYCYPRNNIKVTYQKNANNAIILFKVQLPNGNIVTFDKTETCTLTGYLPISQTFNSSWLITKVESQNQTVLGFSYGTDTSPKSSYKVAWKGKDRVILNVSGTATTGSINYTASYTKDMLMQIYNAGVLVDITYKAATAVNFATLTKPWLSLDSITISFAKINDGNGYYNSPLKYRYKFTYNGTGLARDNFFLQGYSIKVPDVELPYTFTYYTGTLPSVGSTSRDLWGYYNGLSNATIVPAIYQVDTKITPIKYTNATLLRSGGSRYSSLSATRRGTLYSITSPEGLEKRYHYGLNSIYFNNSNSYNGAGLRVDSIEYFNFSTKTDAFRFKYYSDNYQQYSSGRLLYHPVSVYGTNSTSYDVLVPGTAWTGYYTYIESSYQGDGVVPFALPVYYTRVETSSIAPGSTVYTFGLPVDKSATGVIPAELNWSGTDPYYKRLISDSNGWVIVSESDPITPPLFNLWLNPMLLQVQVMNKSGVVVQNQTYNYGPLEVCTVFHGLKLFPVFDGNCFHSSKLHHLTAWRELRSIINTTFTPDGTGGTSTNTQFSYTRPPGSYHFSFVKRKQESSISDESMIIKYKYCFEPDFDYSAAYQAQQDTCFINLQTCLSAVQQSTGLPFQVDLPSVEEESCYDAYDNCIPLLASPEVKAIDLLKDRHDYASPIEEITMLQKGTTKNVISASFSTFVEQASKSVLPVKTYLLDMNVDSINFVGLHVNTAATPYTLGYDPRYMLSSKVTRYSNNDRVLEFVGADSVYTALVWAPRGNSPILQGVNCRYENVENYNSGYPLDYRDLNRQAMITTYEYFYPLGEIMRTDERGRNTYTIYNTLGQQVAIKDHDNGLRRLTVNRLANQVGEPLALAETDPFGDANLIREWYWKPLMNVDFECWYKLVDKCNLPNESLIPTPPGPFCQFTIKVLPYSGYGPYSATFTIARRDQPRSTPTITTKTIDNITSEGSITFLESGYYTVTCKVSDGVISSLTNSWNFVIETEYIP